MSAAWDCPKCDAIVLGSRCPRCEADDYDPAAVRRLVGAARAVFAQFTAEHMDYTSGTDCGSALRAALAEFPEETP